MMQARTGARKPGGMKTLIVNLCILGLSLLVALAVGELAVRWLDPAELPPVSGIYARHETAGYAFLPNVSALLEQADRPPVEFTTDRHGLWETDQAAYDDRPILILGDSFTHGVYCCELSETFPKQTQRYLEAQGIEKVVINAGVPGFSTFNEVGLLSSLADAVDPGLVVLTFYIGNDITENAHPTTPIVRDGGLYVDHRNESTGAIQGARRLLGRSALYRAASKLATQLLFHRQSFIYRKFREQSPEGRAEMAAGIAQSERFLLDYKRFCDDEGLDCMVYIIPSQFQVADDRETMAERYGFDPDTLDFVWQQRHLADFFERHGITYVDLTPIFLDHERQACLFLTVNRHWTREGSSLAGQVLADYLAGTLPWAARS